jgi:hypothetical protein
LYLTHRTSEALEAIREAEALVERREERWWCAELHRFKGVFLAAIGTNEAQIEASFCEAIRIAKEQKSVSLEKRASRTWIPSTSLLTFRNSLPFVQRTKIDRSMANYMVRLAGSPSYRQFCILALANDPIRNRACATNSSLSDILDCKLAVRRYQDRLYSRSCCVITS